MRRTTPNGSRIRTSGAKKKARKKRTLVPPRILHAIGVLRREMEFYDTERGWKGFSRAASMTEISSMVSQLQQTSVEENDNEYQETA